MSRSHTEESMYSWFLYQTVEFELSNPGWWLVNRLVTLSDEDSFKSSLIKFKCKESYLT
uniref:Uncharacterized protein n=1 Tax=Arion vulgaris TaxID=1028688 RepID=A0A0B7BW68_9EUPU